MGWTLAQLTDRFGLRLVGDGEVVIEGVCALAPGRSGALAFLADPRYRGQLLDTQASAVVLRERDREHFSGPALIAADPALAFAQIAAIFDDSRSFTAGIHPSAVIAEDVVLGRGVGIGAQVVIESGTQIGDDTYIGPGCVIGRQAVVGPGSRLEARVWLGARCEIGARASIHPGVVVGSRGFGNVRAPQGWIEVPQLGRVLIGSDVEIGANTCIDRGSLDDTVIEDGVKLDNQIQIAHNCRIGAHTAIAACAGIAGSTQIGKRCMIGGAAGIGGHLKIGDDIVILGRAMVTKSLSAPGVYGSGLPIMPARTWRRVVARVRRLGIFDERLARLESALKLDPIDGNREDESNDL